MPSIRPLMLCCSNDKANGNILRKLNKTLKHIECRGGVDTKTIDTLMLYIDGVTDIVQEIDTPSLSGDGHAIIEQLYKYGTVDLMLSVIPLLPTTVTNAIVTLLLMTIRVNPTRSLPHYFIENRETLQKVLALFEDPSHFSVANALVQICLLQSSAFVLHLFEIGFVECFIMYLSGPCEFDRLSSTFATYSLMFNAHPDVSQRFVARHKDLFCIQFKQLLTSPDYIFQLLTLECLSAFLYQEENVEFRKYFLSDPETLQLVMLLLRSNSKRVQGEAYYLFRLFVYNPYRSGAVTSILTKNSSSLLSMMDSITTSSHSELMINQLKLMEQEEEANTKYVSDMVGSQIFIDS